MGPGMDVLDFLPGELGRFHCLIYFIFGYCIFKYTYIYIIYISYIYIIYIYYFPFSLTFLALAGFLGSSF